MALSCKINEQLFAFNGKEYNYNEFRALMYDGLLAPSAATAQAAQPQTAQAAPQAAQAAPKGAVDASDVDAMQGLMERHEGNNDSGIPKQRLIGKVVNALRFLKNNNFAYDPKTGKGTRIFIAENNDAQKRAVGEAVGRDVEADDGNIVSRYDDNGNLIGSDIYINLDSASENVVGHEMTHAVLVGLFGKNPKLFKEFVNVLKQSIGKSELKTLNEFISAYEGGDVQAEEFLAEFTGMIENMFASGEVGAKELSALRKLANAIKQFINKLTGGLVFPIEKDSDVRAFFNALGSAIASGGELEKGAAEAAVKEIGFSKEQLQHFASDDASPEVIGGGTISPNYKSSKSSINIYTDKQVSKLPVRSLKDAMSEFDNKIVLINSDPTRIGKLDLPSGKSIFMYGGPGYLALKENTDGGVGFATTQESKVRTYQKYVKELWGGAPGLAGVTTQAPTSVFSNSYSLRYVLDAISTLPKNILKSSDFKSEFFGKDVLLLKEAFGDKSYDDFIRKYKNADFSSSEVIDMMIAEMGYKIGNDNQPASFKARSAFVSNLLAGLASKSERKGFEKETGYILKDPQKFIAKELNGRLGINQVTVMREIAIPDLVDKYIEEGKWGYLVAGFKTDPNSDIKDVQEKGILHPLFNAKFPGNDAFFFDGAYLVDGMLESIQMTGPKGEPYTKRASMMLAGSMYVKGAAEGKEGVFKYAPTKKETSTILGAEKPAGAKVEEIAKRLNLPVLSDKQFKEELEKKLKVPRIDLKSSKKTHKETGFISVPSMIEIVASNDPTYLGDVIEHIFTMGEKLLRGDVGIEDLAKSYMMAISSIRAQARPVDAFGRAIDMDIPAHFIEPGMLIRPEGAMAFLLTTERGKKMLQNIKNGKLSQSDANFVARAMKPFGMFSEGESKHRNLFGIPEKGQINLRNIGEFQSLLKDGVKDTEQLLNATALLKGISLNKSGFVGNFIGIGTRGVIDAREIQGWLRGVIFRGQRTTMEAEVEKELNRPGKELNPLKKEILERMRLVGESFGLDPAVAAYVGHHMIWDAVAQEKTTHDGLYLAMTQNEDEFKAKLEKIEAREKPKVILKSSKKAPIMERVAELKKAIKEDPDTEYYAYGHDAFSVYVAEKLLPKPSDKLKRLTESNSLGLNGDWHSVANVDGVYFGVTKYEDPDAVSDEEDAAGFPKEFVWAYEPLALKGFGVETLMTNSVEKLFADMKETAEMLNEVEAKSTTLKSSKKAKGELPPDTPEENRRVITVAKRRLDKIEGDEKRATERDILMGDPKNYVQEGEYRSAIDQARNFVAELYFKHAKLNPVDFSKAVYEEVKGITNEVSKVVAYGELQASLDMYAESKKLSSKDRKEIQRISAKMVSDMAQQGRKRGQANAALALVYNNYGKFASLVQAERINIDFTAKLNSTEGSEEGKTVADNIEEARDEIKETLAQNKEIADVVDLAEDVNDALEDGHAAKVAAGESTPLQAPAPVTAEQLVNDPSIYGEIISELEEEVKRLDGLLAQVNKLYSSAAADAASYAQQVADLGQEINKKNKLIDRLKDKKNEIAKERDKYKNQVDVLKQKIADLKDINKLLAQKRVGKDRLSPSKIEKLRQQLLDLALAGKLNDPDFDAVFAAITGGNFLTTQDRKAIEHMANALKYFESAGSKEMAQKYVKRLNDYLERQSKEPWTAAKVAILLQSWFYNNVLSSIGTFFNAFAGSVLVSIPNATVASINIALKDRKSGLGATLYGMRRMLQELPTAISKGAMNQRAYDSMGTSWTVDSVSKYADPFEVHVLNGFFTHWDKIKNNPSLVEKSKACIAMLGSIVAQATRITALLKFIDPVLRHSLAAHMEGMEDYIKIKGEMRMKKTEPGIAEAWTPYFSPRLIKKIDEMAGVARADRSAAAFGAMREVATMKSRGISVPLDYARRRTSEIMREKRNAEQTLTTDKMAADMIMMWKPDGVLGYAWDKLGKKTAINEGDNVIEAFTKLALNLSVLPFLRISAQGVSEIQSTIPAIGGIAAAYGVAKNKDGEWYVGKKYSENVQDREFEIQRMQRRIALNILSSVVIAGLFAEVFDVEDAEDDDEEAMNVFGMRKKITLDPNRKIDFTSDARGPKSANQGIMEGRANFSMRIRAGSNEEWSDWMSVRLAPHMTIPVAWLGRLSDDANRLYQKPAFGSGATPKRAALNEYFTSVPLSALGEVSFQTLPRFFSGLKYDAGAAAARMFMSPVAAIAQPSIYRDVVGTVASMADATRKGEYMPEGFIGTSKAMFSSLYGLNYSISPEVTDEYGLPIKAIDPIRSWWKNYTDIEKRSDDHPEVNLRWKYGNTFIEATPRSQRIENVPRKAKPGQEGVYSKNVELTKDQQELSSKLTKALLRNSILSNYDKITQKADAARKDKYEMPGEIVADEINKRHRKTVDVATNVFAEIVAGKMSERDVINKINQLNSQSDKLSELIKGGKPLPKVQDEVQFYVGKESVRVTD